MFVCSIKFPQDTKRTQIDNMVSTSLAFTFVFVNLVLRGGTKQLRNLNLKLKCIVLNEINC